MLILQDALELRIYLHNRSLLQYADSMEGSGIGLIDLMSMKPADLVSKFGMRKSHVSTFIDTSGFLWSSNADESSQSGFPNARPVHYLANKRDRKSRPRVASNESCHNPTQRSPLSYVSSSGKRHWRSNHEVLMWARIVVWEL